MKRAASFLAACALVALPTVAQAFQTLPVAPPNGIAVADARAWLTGLGARVDEPTTEADDGTAWTMVVYDEPRNWTLTLLNCTAAGLCDDVQFTTVLSGPFSVDGVNSWNRHHRYLRAFFLTGETPETGIAVGQYDVVLTGIGVEQLREPTTIWLDHLRQFAETLGSLE